MAYFQSFCYFKGTKILCRCKILNGIGKSVLQVLFMVLLFAFFILFYFIFFVLFYSHIFSPVEKGRHAECDVKYACGVFYLKGKTSNETVFLLSAVTKLHKFCSFIISSSRHAQEFYLSLFYRLAFLVLTILLRPNSFP